MTNLLIGNLSWLRQVSDRGAIDLRIGNVLYLRKPRWHELNRKQSNGTYVEVSYALTW